MTIKTIKKARNKEAGFTLMELMVVVAIIALIAVFSLPQLTKQIARTKLTDGISAASNVGSQIMSACAVRGPNTPRTQEVEAMLASLPNGYSGLSLTSESCATFRVKFTSADPGTVPNLCIERSGPKLLFTTGSLTQADLTRNDVPLPDTSLKVPFDGGC